MVDFLIIGTQRGGTTSFYHHLLQHPQILPAYRSNLHFFDSNYSKGIEWYAQQFPLVAEYTAANRPANNITGEASSPYMFHPLVPERVKKHYPNIKLIALLRNPTDRAYAHFRFAVEKGLERLSFTDALRVEAKRLERVRFNLEDNPFHSSSTTQYHAYISHGFYAQQLRRWFDHFDRRNFMVIKSEDFFRDPVNTLLKTFEFLELDEPKCLRTDVHPPDPFETLKSDTRHIVDKLYRQHNEDLCHMLGWKRAW